MSAAASPSPRPLTPVHEVAERPWPSSSERTLGRRRGPVGVERVVDFRAEILRQRGRVGGEVFAGPVAGDRVALGRGSGAS